MMTSDDNDDDFWWWWWCVHVWWWWLLMTSDDFWWCCCCLYEGDCCLLSFRESTGVMKVWQWQSSHGRCALLFHHLRHTASFASFCSFAKRTACSVPLQLYRSVWCGWRSVSANLLLLLLLVVLSYVPINNASCCCVSCCCYHVMLLLLCHGIAIVVVAAVVSCFCFRCLMLLLLLSLFLLSHHFCRPVFSSCRRSRSCCCKCHNCWRIGWIVSRSASVFGLPACVCVSCVHLCVCGGATRCVPWHTNGNVNARKCVPGWKWSVSQHRGFGGVLHGRHFIRAVGCSAFAHGELEASHLQAHQPVWTGLLTVPLWMHVSKK